jgi:folate-binding Fe-S cluster repair protein YgfZ
MMSMTTILALEARRSGVVAVERPDLAVLGLRGADVLRYLHTVSSQHTAELRPGDATSALLLSPKGKIEFAFRLAVTEGGALLDTQAAAAQALAERLERFVFRYDVAVRVLEAGGLSLLGPGAPACRRSRRDRTGRPWPAGWWSTARPPARTCSAPRPGRRWRRCSASGWRGRRWRSGSSRGSSSACRAGATS